jgi:hypothetical protein
MSGREELESLTVIEMDGRLVGSAGEELRTTGGEGGSIIDCSGIKEDAL